jgi:hypothetical protein
LTTQLHQTSNDKSQITKVLLWAGFLACSWTWCIGLFLPVLLMREHGVWGWIIFAIPNVIGAAAMGWLIVSGDQSRAIAAAHGPALTAFSLVTAAFQVFFTFWIFARLSIGGHDFAQATIAFALLVVAFPGALRPAAGPVVAAFVLIASCLCAIQMWRTGALVDPRIWLAQAGNVPSRDILWLAPVSCFGFGLCPWLDRTFHLARQELSARESRIAFTLGFGLIFLAIILLTLAYAAPLMVHLADSRPQSDQFFLRWLALYFLIQLGFTIGVHWSSGVSLREKGGVGRFLGMALLSLAIGFLAWFATRFIQHARLEPGELIYRIFMGFYGLVFPAYVWLCVIPGRGQAPPTRGALVKLGVVVLLTWPAFWMGFIEGRMFWLIPGLAVVLLAGLL